ncbi:MAG TPA: SCO family protein [Kofleriaceae bacterium]|jgi:protein SCO1/2
MVAKLHIALLATLVSSSAWAAGADDEIVPASPTYRANGVTVDEHIGARLPLDAEFRTADGEQLTLGSILRGDLPVILTFNYSDCPMLCSLQLNGLSAALPKVAVSGPSPDPKKSEQIAFRVGQQFRIVTIDLEPNEPLAKLQKMRDKYLARLPEDLRATARTGWTFLAAGKAGDDASIRRVAETVGFKYKYLPDKAEFAHPAALIFTSSSGKVTRYVYGIDYDTATMRESIYKAGLSEPATAVGFLNRCYHFDPDANAATHAGVWTLRIGAGSFVALGLAGFVVLRLLRRRRRWGTA